MRRLQPHLQSLEGRFCPSGGGLSAGLTTNSFPQFNLTPPAQVDTGYFGIEAVLSNGNILAGSATGVCLFNGNTGALISTLTGATSVTPLANGNFVATGPGTATWGSGTTGVSGSVSGANSLLAAGSTDVASVIPLTNGNYVVEFPDWSGKRGAATWGNGTTGTTGIVSAANSLVGGNLGDYAGSDGQSPTITALSNGNYVVASNHWNTSAGAVTWGNGMTGVSGTISDSNSLVGVGSLNGVMTVTPLTNGNYVISDTGWNNEAGEVTWASGTSPVTGTVSTANSLIGSSPNDLLGYGVTALTNGNFVVASPYWSGGGAATWGDGTKGVTGVISADNSLVGSVGSDDTVASGSPTNGHQGVVALANGNYVVLSPNWDRYTGAVTWGNGATGTVGIVLPTNSIVGDVPNGIPNRYDEIGHYGVVALANGNYVVNSPQWNIHEGAVTWGDGTKSTAEVVSPANSLVGDHPSTPTSSDQVGSGGITALANGNYVVNSPSWFGTTGAATWENGTSATAGAVSAANSLIGSEAGDEVGIGGVTALTNGNYVVDSYVWSNSEGAVTWGNGKTGIIGTISASNSLTGSAFLIGNNTGDSVGAINANPALVGGVTALPNGNYVVISTEWSGRAGAVTFGNGTTGTVGSVSIANSLIDIPSIYPVGVVGISILPNNNYVFTDSPANEPSIATWFDGNTGLTRDGQNIPDPQNSIYGGTGGLITIRSNLTGTSFVFAAAGDDHITVATPNPTQTPSVDFVIGSDGMVYTRRLDVSGNPTSSYYQVAYGQVKNLAVTRFDNTTNFEAFVIGMDNQVYADTIISGKSSGYLATAYGSIASVSSGTDASGNPIMFAIGTDNQLYEQKFDASGKATSGSYTKAAYGDFKQTFLTHDASGNPLLYALGQDNQVYGLKMLADGTPNGGLFKVDYGPVKQLAVGHDAANNPEIFVIGTDNAVYAHKLDATGSPVGTYLGLGGVALSIAVGSASNGNPLVFALGSDNQVYAHRFDASGTPSGNYYGTASGSATSIAVGNDAAGNPALFTVFSSNSQVYAEPFDATGNSTGAFTLTTQGAVKKLVLA